MSQQYTVVRDGKKDLRFIGKKLADVSSRSDQPRWTEIRIYATNIGSGVRLRKAYVAEIVGRSTIDGEKDRCAAFVCNNADDVANALRAGRDYLTDLAKDAMYEAAESDPAFTDAITEDAREHV